MAITKEVDQNMKESRQLKVSLKATAGHPHIAAGKVFTVHPAQEAKLKENGWAVGESDDHTKVKDPKKPAAATNSGEGGK